MAKNFGNDHNIFALVFRLFRYFVVVAAVGPRCTAAFVIINDTSVNVTDHFLFSNRPVWIDNGVYFVDELQLLFIRYDLNTGKTISIDVGKSFQFLVPVKDRDNPSFVGGDGNSVYWFSWDGTPNDIFIHDSLPVLRDPGESFLCAKGDPQGRLFIGSSVSATQGRLYMVESNGLVTTVLENIGMVRDIAWSTDADNLRMYIADASTNTIVCYVYGKDKGVSDVKCKEFFEFKVENGLTCVANGMTVDIAGNLWVACLGESYVVQIDVVISNYMIQLKILDNVGTTNVVFGGKTMEDLYITTINNPTQEKSGSLFHVANTGYKGVEVQSVDVAWGK